MSKSILITGGTGFIGFHLARKCLDLKWSVTSLSTSYPRKNRKLKKVSYKICDISNFNLLTKKIKPNFDYVVNLAGYVDHTNRSKTMRSHYVGCKNLSTLFLNSKIKKFVQIGSSIEYGRVKSPQTESNLNNKAFSIYGTAKLLSTQFLQDLFKKLNFPATILRLYLVYGPNQDANRVVPITIINAMKDKTFDCSNGLQLRDFIYVDDVINAIIMSLKNPKSTGEIINIGSGKPVSVKKVIAKICTLLNSGKPQYGKIKLRKDEIMKLYPNINKARKILNWKPNISLEKGLKKTIQFFNK